MSRHFRLIAVLLTALMVTLWSPASAGSSDAPDQPQHALVVHEWGTFTSIAGPDGKAIEWLPLNGPSDLPCFVNRFAFNLKGTLPGTVRMETPVLYFYGPAGTAVDVNVRFQRGVVTEWFPPAAVTPSPQAVSLASLFRPDFASGIHWKGLTLQETAQESFPREEGTSHYYAARRTDASSLQSGTVREKFLFYRGIGGFQPPITASMASNGQIIVKSTNGEALGDVVLFDNHRGAITYQVRSGVNDQAMLDLPSVDGEFAAPLSELEQILVAHGLYPKEAKAMVETWRDSWFEEGTRVFYIAPQSAIDAILPLDVKPVPADVVRVFVGRIEILAESRTREVENALRNRDWVTLGLYGRFLEPMAKQILAGKTSAERTKMESSLKKIVDSSIASARTCK
jgi:hypothetical protein